jgi:hypothetical protein
VAEEGEKREMGGEEGRDERDAVWIRLSFYYKLVGLKSELNACVDS